MSALIRINTENMVIKHGSAKKQRRSIRLKEYDYSNTGAYFITICTQKHKLLLGEISNEPMQLNYFGKIVLACLNNIPSHYPYVELDTYVIMPNHIHIIIAVSVGAIHELPLPKDRIIRRQMLIPKIVGYIKMNTAKQINRARNTVGKPVWQRNYYEHIIRDEDDLYIIRQYISENPLKWEDDKYNPTNLNVRTKIRKTI